LSVDTEARESVGPQATEDEREAVNVIEDMTGKLEPLFLEFRRYHHDYYSDPTYRDYRDKLDARQRAIRGMSPEEREALQEEFAEELESRERINREIREQFERLTPETYPKGDPNTPMRMLWLFKRVSEAYRPEACRRGASVVAVMLYLHSCLDTTHASWYAVQWLAATLQVGYWTEAEAWMYALTKEPGVSDQFAKAKTLRHALPVARSVLALNRDEDPQEALTYAEHAKKNCAFIPGVVEYHKALDSAVRGYTRSLEHHESSEDAFSEPPALFTVSPALLITGAVPNGSGGGLITYSEAEEA
jgi:hypothetical protein